MKLLRPVDADAHQPVVLLEEAAPLVRQHRAIGLDAVLYGPAAGVLALQGYRLLVKGEGAHQRLPAVPGEEHLRHGLRADVFPDELLQQRVTHHVLGIVLIQLALFQVITIVASQVAKGAGRLQHHVERAGKGGIGCGHVVLDKCCNGGKDNLFRANPSPNRPIILMGPNQPFLRSRFVLPSHLLPTKSLCIDKEKVGRRGDFGATLG